MQTAEDLERRAGDALAEHLVIACTGGAGRTSIEALQPEDGLNRWWFDIARSLDDIAANADTIFVATHTLFRFNEREPGLVFALRARDRAVLWRTDEQSLRWHLARLKLTYGVRVALSQISVQTGRHAAESIQLARYIYLAADGDMLFACCGPVIFALDAHSGAFCWAHATPNGQDRRLITAHGGRVYAKGDHHGLFALDAHSGRLLWGHEDIYAPSIVVANEAHVYVYPATAVTRRRASRAAEGMPIAVMRAADGTLERMHSIQTKEEALARLTADGIAYLMRSNGLHAVRLSDGKELWHSDTLAGLARQEPEMLNNIVRVEATEQHVFYAYRQMLAESHVLIVGALDAASGAPLWQWRGPAQPLPMQHGVQLTAALGNLYLTSYDGMHAFSGDNGRLLWLHAPDYDEQLLAPVIV